jgi:hypothetical protein
VRVRAFAFAFALMASIAMDASATEPGPHEGTAATPVEEESRHETDEPETESESEKAPGRTIGASPESVDAQLAEAQAPADALIDEDLIAPIRKLWSVPTNWLRKELGLSLGLNYTMLYQHASRARGTNDPMFGDLDLLALWRLPKFGEEWSASIALQAEWRHRLTSDTPGKLSRRVGSQWATAVSADSQRFALTQVYFEQHGFGDDMIARVGKIDSALIYDAGRYVSQNLAFLSAAFSDSPAMAFPAAGLGAAVAVYPTDWLYLIGGVHDASARRTQVGFNSIDDKDFFYAGEVGFTPWAGTDHEGHYHLTGWRSEKASRLGKPSGHGFRLYGEQALGPQGRIVPFARYGYSSGGITSTKQDASVGIALEDPFAHPRDLIGIALGWGEPKRSQDRDQYTLEAFYRLQLTPLLSVTPDTQVIFDPSQDRSRDTIWIFSLRTRAVF